MLLILKPPKRLPQAATNFLTFNQAGISIADSAIADGQSKKTKAAIVWRTQPGPIPGSIQPMQPLMVSVVLAGPKPGQHLPRT